MNIVPFLDNPSFLPQITGCAHWSGLPQSLNKPDQSRRVLTEIRPDILYSGRHDIMAATIVDHASSGLNYNRIISLRTFSHELTKSDLFSYK